MPRRAIATTNQNVAFLKHLADRENKNRDAERPEPLSAEQHASLRNKLKDVDFVRPKLSQETEINIGGILGKWKRYCADQKLGGWREALDSLTRETTMSFFLYVGERSNLRSSGSSRVYIRQFQQLYTTATGHYMDRNDVKEVYKFHDRVIVPHFNLRAPNTDGKPVLGVEDLRAILTFNIAYDMGIFQLERQRVQLAGCYQILCYTGARPGELVQNERKKPQDGSVDELFKTRGLESTNARHHNSPKSIEGDDEVGAEDEGSLLLNGLLLQETVGRGRPKALCYEDILLMIVRHPVTGAPTPAMAIKFVHHKGADNKPKPTIFYFTPAKKLIFCAVSTIIALALHDHAFDAASLTSASRILRAQIRGPTQCTPLRWKASMLKTPVFRRIHGTQLAADEAMPYSKLRDDMGRQSLDAGFEKRWTPRFARRGAANAANGNAPDAVRDQMMRHDPKFATFHNAYINQNVNFDLQNTFLEEDAENQMYKLFAHVSLTRDPRATSNMVPAELWNDLEPDRAIVKMQRRRAELKDGRYRIKGKDKEAEIRMLTNQIRLMEARRDSHIVKEYRNYYFHNRPTWDIEAQARGEEQEEYVEPEIDLRIPERRRLAEILCHQSDNWTQDDVLQQRIEAIDLMVVLCDKRESAKRDRLRPRARAEPPVAEDVHPPMTVPLVLNAKQCPVCVGDERLPLEERTFKYCRTTVRNDHFDDQHLEERERTVTNGGVIRCNHPQCRDEPRFQKMESLDAFRNHVRVKHGVSLRTTVQVAQRRENKARHRRMRQGFV
ncbi:FluG domain-containing protein [Colletotrichum limetticola]|uniref:FluG domain-containing protein n=1 Tax=Colletotrichum limetticola TaxID=1209924 RepID=A0ABQ9PBJ6_9PEZI|nr:FluG domain-containing protein [Colletotrichum limetticola]